MQNVVVDPVFPPKVKVGVGTVSIKVKLDENCDTNSGSVQLQEVINRRPSFWSI